MQRSVVMSWVPKKQHLKRAHYLWSPCLFWMKLCGIYHWRPDTEKGSWNKWKCYSVACGIAAIVVVLGAIVKNPLVANGFVSGLNHYNIRLLGAFLNHFQTVFSMAMFFAASRSPAAGFSMFYHYWHQLSFMPHEVRHIERNCRSWAFRTAAVFLIIVIAQSAVLITQASINTLSSHLPMHCISHGFFYIIELASGLLFLLICQALHKLFSVLNRRAFDFQRTRNSPLLNFDGFYQNYVMIVNMVEVIDDAFSLYLGSYVCITLLQLIFRTFVIIYPVDSGLSYWIYVCIFIRQFMLLCAVLWAAARVHLQAHKSFSAFHKMDLDLFPESMQAKVLSFRSFLGSGVVSLSLFKVQSITMGIISSLLSFYLTYALVLYQFN